MRPEPKNLEDLTKFTEAELAEELGASLELKPFRAKQLVRWIYQRRVRDFDLMSDIAKDVRTQLAKRYFIGRPSCVRVQKSVDGTRKFLFSLNDGSEVETVLIRQPKRVTLCVSSQVGCAIGCTFCRTAQMGFRRNLGPHEIVGQALAVLDFVQAEKDKEPESDILPFENIVFMGMGEPLHNVENVIKAVEIFNHPLGFDFSGRKITVSTSGLVPAIKRLFDSGARANLALSLNATTDDVRSRIMPVNRKYSIDQLFSTIRELPLKPRQRVTIEYVLLREVNDTLSDSRRLIKLLHGIPAKVNLIPYNQNTGLGFKSPKRQTVVDFQKRLLDAEINATIRWSKGEDIDAACGQLASHTERRAA